MLQLDESVLAALPEEIRRDIEVAYQRQRSGKIKRNAYHLPANSKCCVHIFVAHSVDTCMPQCACVFIQFLTFCFEYFYSVMMKAGLVIHLHDDKFKNVFSQLRLLCVPEEPLVCGRALFKARHGNLPQS